MALAPDRLQLWLSDVQGRTGRQGLALDAALLHVADECRGRVKFFTEKGWGGIESGDTPMDVWVHGAHIDGPGYQSLAAGQRVLLRWEPAFQDSWRCVAPWVKAIEGP